MPRVGRRRSSSVSVRKAGSGMVRERVVDLSTDSRKMQKPEAAQNKAVSPQRSAMMARIGQKDTAPEIFVRKLLHRLGFRFRLHRRDLPGTPDIVLAGQRVALLVHGCFWHRHPGCRFAYIPKSRTDFWSAKFARNVARDREVLEKLRALGWRAHVIWECETGDEAAL